MVFVDVVKVFEEVIFDDEFVLFVKKGKGGVKGKVGNVKVDDVVEDGVEFGRVLIKVEKEKLKKECEK